MCVRPRVFASYNLSAKLFILTSIKSVKRPGLSARQVTKNKQDKGLILFSDDMSGFIGKASREKDDFAISVVGGSGSKSKQKIITIDNKKDQFGDVISYSLTTNIFGSNKIAKPLIVFTNVGMPYDEIIKVSSDDADVWIVNNKTCKNNVGFEKFLISLVILTEKRHLFFFSI